MSIADSMGMYVVRPHVKVALVGLHESRGHPYSRKCEQLVESGEDEKQTAEAEHKVSPTL